MTQIPNPDLGLASSGHQAFTGQAELLAGDTPALVSLDGVAGALGAAGLPAWTPVVYDRATGAISAAEHGTAAPNAVTAHAVTPGSPAGSAVAVYSVGCFNINALNWPASFDTEAKRRAAFDLSACLIFVKNPYNG